MKRIALSLPFLCTLTSALTAGTPVSSPSPAAPMLASPQPVSLWDGFYLKAFGGTGGITADSFSLNGASTSADYGAGWLAGMSIGKQFTDHISLEVEWTYRSNDVDGVRRGRSSVGGGDLASTGLFVNLGWTFAGWGAAGSRWRPYAAIGAGFMEEVDMDLTAAGIEDVSDTWVPAVQGIVGLEKELGRRWSFFGEARYLYAGDTDLSAESGARQNVTVDYQGWSALVGLRFNF
jgi:hypothetical protein